MAAPVSSTVFFDPSPAQRRLRLALIVSLALHGVLLSIHFKLPQALNKATERALDVILVNSRSAAKPQHAQAKGQVNLDGGGNTDEDRRIKTPLPVAPRTQEGNDLVEAKKRISDLEAQQQSILTRMRSDKRVASDARQNAPDSQNQPTTRGFDLVNASLDLARLEGQISRNLEEYNKRPRRKNIGARVEEYRFAQYVEDWRQKVERIGNLNYPEAAKGRLYGSLVLTVVIRADGHLERVDVDRSSGHKVLDDAAKRIVQMAAPFAAFPEAIRRDTDIIEVSRTWNFTTADRLFAE